MSGASIDVCWVIFDSYMHCFHQKAGSIVFISLITALCAFNEVTWTTNEVFGPPKKLIDDALIVEL